MEKHIFMHHPHNHMPRNPNELHEAEQAASGFNQRLAITLTKFVGSMPCAYFFAVIALIGFPGLLGAQVSLYVQWVSQTLIQLTMLSILMVGQSVLARKQELQADATFADAEKTYHDTEQIVLHLNAQDTELAHLESALDLLNKSVQQLIRRVDQATGRGAA